jgi:hypothetical protein
MSRLEAFVAWLTQTDDEQEESVDVEYLSESDIRYKYMTIGDDPESYCRCDLCGHLLELEAFPELVDHVAAHDQQGAAEIDPFEIAKQQTMITKELLSEVEEWRSDNIDEVDT